MANINLQYPYKLWEDDLSKYTRSDMVGIITHSDNRVSGNAALGYKKIGSENPNWRNEVLKGTDATRPYTLQRQFGAPNVCRASMQGALWPNGPKFYSWGYNVVSEDVFFFGIPHDQDLITQATHRLKNKIRRQTSATNAAVPLGELRELRKLLHDLIGSGGKLVQTLLTIKASKGKSAAQFASNAWLQWSFGIAPTLSSVDDILSGIDGWLNEPDRTVRLSSQASKDWISGWKPGRRTGIFGADLDRSYSYHHSLSYRLTCGIRLSTMSGNNYGLGGQLGLELAALPSVAWELTAYSWLFDYFTNVGQLMEDNFMSLPGNTTFVVLNKRYEVKCQQRFKYISYIPNVNVAGSCTSNSRKLLYFDRSKLSSLPYGSFRFKSVDEVGKNAVNKLLNLSALLIQRR